MPATAKLTAEHWATQYQPDLYGDRRHDVLRVIDASADSMAHPQGPRVIADVNPNAGNALAFAALIAAAPDMLVALRQALPLVEAHARATLGEGAATAAVMRAAIAKATTPATREE